MNKKFRKVVFFSSFFLFSLLSASVDVPKIFARQFEAISVDSNNQPVIGGWPAMSADGRFIAFTTIHYGPPDPYSNTNTQAIAVRDRSTQTTEFVSLDNNGNFLTTTNIWGPSISADGRFVAFGTDAAHIFVRDRIQHATETLPSPSELGIPVISANGRFVLYGCNLYDRNSAGVEVINFSPGSDSCNGGSAISVDGRYIVGTTYWGGVQVLDRQTGLVKIADPAIDGVRQIDYPPSGNVAISIDGRFVAFTSPASNLVPGDTNGYNDVFVRDMVAGTTERVNTAEDGTQANGYSNYSGDLAVSGDGRFVAFSSDASNLVSNDAPGTGDIFVKDLQTGQIERIAGDPWGWYYSYVLSMSADGRFLAFMWPAGYSQYPETQLIPGYEGGNGIDLYLTPINLPRNQPPSANAGADLTGFVGQSVTLNGSGSTDPDGQGDIVNYAWNFGDGATGSGAIINHVYVNNGVYSAILTDSDTAGATSSDTVTVTVLTPVQAVQNLISLVQTFNLQQGIENSLDVKLNNAVSALSDLNIHNNGAAINSLQVFINAVTAQKGNKITNTQADQLIHDAQLILNNLSS